MTRMGRNSETMPVRNKEVANAELMPAIKTLLTKGHTVTFKVRGRSMRPFLDDGRDKVILMPCEVSAIKPGDAILAETFPGVYVFHRVVKLTEGTVTLRGDGNVRGTETCALSAVVGRARGFYRKGRQHPDLCSGLKWRLYSLLWPSSPFCRRVLLAFHRRVVLRLFPSTPHA